MGGVLLLINGAPGVGKSTLARRYAEEHPLALVIDIDAIRTQLGQWAQVEESRLVARDLAVALARAHLTKGHDVVVPQYLGRPEFRAQLQLLADEIEVPLVEVLLTDHADRITMRFRRRRTELVGMAAAHPQSDLSDDAVAAEVARANDALVHDATQRDVVIISAADGPDASHIALRERLASR
jgi:predicted kinase